MKQSINEWIASSGLYNYEIIEDKYIIGRYRVLFGYRIRGGKIGDMCFGFDVCCGTSTELLNKVQDIYSKFMRKNLQDGNLYFAGLRGFSQIKPAHKDIDYMKWLIDKEQELCE